MQCAWDRYDRLSVIGALVLSPSRRRIDTPFQIQEENVRTPDIVAFIKALRKRIRRPLIVCWDRWSVHRSAGKQIAASRVTNVYFELLPAYAPELNPVEACWSHSKYADLANFVPDDVPHLKRHVRLSLKKHQSNQQLKQSFFKTAQLRL